MATKVDISTIKSRLDEALEEEALAKTTLEVTEALARMSVHNHNNVSRILTHPDSVDVATIPDGVEKLRARNHTVGLIPEAYVGDVPVSGKWMSGLVIPPTPLDLSSKLAIELMYDLIFRPVHFILPEVRSVPAGGLPGGCITSEILEEARTSRTVQVNDWTARKERMYWVMCPGTQGRHQLHRRLHSYQNATLVI